MPYPHSNSDARLDAKLRNVALPAGLLARLRDMIAMSDDELDAALRDVPIPLGLQRRVERMARRRLRMQRLMSAATAASLFLATALAYVGAVVGVFVMAYTLPQPPTAEPALTVTAGLAPGAEGDVVDLEGIELAALQPKPPPAPTMPVPPVPGAGLANRMPVSDSPIAEMTERYGFAVPYDGTGVDLLMDRYLAAWPEETVLTNHPTDGLPELKKVPGLARQGVTLPLVPGLDPAFEILHQVHPFLVPAAHPALRTSDVPLGIDAASFELTKRYLEDGELPPRRVLRTEEFLAAVDYGYPEPQQQPLALHAAGGASPFRGPRLDVLQFGIQAVDVPDPSRRPTRLTLAVDVSASMRWGGRLEMVRRAIDRVIDRITPEDRVSLVWFSEEAYVVVRSAGHEEADLLRAAVADLTPRESTNLSAGLRHAFAVAQRAARPEESVNRVVLLSDGLSRVDETTAERIVGRLADAANAGVTLHVVDLAPDRDPKEADPLLTRFAQAGGGWIRRATTTEQVGWALLEALTDRPQLVAADVRLRVVFNPKTTVAYRLVGHEATMFAGLKPAPLATDFCSGQSATAFYEVVLREGPESEVALAELTWTDPRSGQSQSVTRKVRRGQFAESLVDAPLWVQAGALVAEAGEALRGVPEVWLLPSGYSTVRPRLGEWSLARLRQAAWQLDSRLEENDSLAEFLEVVSRAGSARPHREGIGKEW